MKREVIVPEGAPKPVGPYSPAIRWGNLVFCSGQTGVDPKTGKLVEGVEAQARQTLENLSGVLQASGTDLAHAVKTTVFLTDINDFATLNAAYGEFFPNDPPARTTVAVTALPIGALLEIEVIAAVE
jgi:2-iminobutanoate/2-iminopropanoate deaminase